MDFPEISLKDYNYTLPQTHIAQFPLEERDASKLLIYRNGLISENIFKNIAGELPGNSLIVFNETKVVQARLIFQKPTGAKIEIFCLEPIAPVKEIQSAFAQNSGVIWKCFIGNAKKWKDGLLKQEIISGNKKIELVAEKLKPVENAWETGFSWKPANLTFADVLEKTGLTPLPPYLGRDPIDDDRDRYQTVYARQNGSVAAPTAGLHFTSHVLEQIKEKNIKSEKLTLHVGAGTFVPISAETIAQHHMHTEQIIISADTIRNLLNFQGKIISVGTTTLRALESLYWFGAKRLIDGPQETFSVYQWDPYNEKYKDEISVKDALNALLADLDKKKQTSIFGTTQLMIVPGYNVKMADILITNFHQPQSTLLLLVAAFIGSDWRKTYQYALEHNFRFLSYGDSCLYYR